LKGIPDLERAEDIPERERTRRKASFVPTTLSLIPHLALIPSVPAIAVEIVKKQV